MVSTQLIRPKRSLTSLIRKGEYEYRDALMQDTGLMVPSWPIVLGCDASGIVVETGENAKEHFQLGDQVAGCTRLGEPGHGTFQEFVRRH